MVTKAPSRSLAKKANSPRKIAEKKGPIPKPKPKPKPEQLDAAPLALSAALDSTSNSDNFSVQAIRLAFLIHDVSRMRRAVYDQIMKPFNFTRARWWVLAHLSRHDGMMQSQLADVLEVGKASLGSVIEQLEADGWVERRSDPSDKRAKRVFLTRSAQPFIKKMTVAEDEFNRRALAGLDGDDRATLIQLLSQIKESLQSIGKVEGEAE